MTEAKDWAGELISGQTTTGRILVSTKTPKLKLCKYTKHTTKLDANSGLASAE